MTAAFLEARLGSPEDQLDHKVGVYIVVKARSTNSKVND
jgi:hypothetical protein